ncbi:hypothetical protein BC830DRAFT_1066230 [Chytriomyces sp. MP71]|nr:hypothetical protein BC830DRAFT_1066230 [Chytriomyces sp. MP71]
MIHTPKNEATSGHQKFTKQSAKLPEARVAAAIKEFYSALTHIPISKLLEHKRASRPDHSLQLVSVPEETPLRDVLKVLAEHHVLAVPTTRIVQDHPQDKTFTGIVSIYDVLAWSVFNKLFDDLQALDTSAETGTEGMSFLALDQEAEAYFSTPVSTLIGMTAESTMSWTIHSSEPVSSILQMLATPPLHRVLVIDVDTAAKSVSFDDEDVPTNTESCIVMVTQVRIIDSFINSYLTWVVNCANPDLQSDVINFLFTQADSIFPALADEGLRAQRNMEADPNQLSTSTVGDRSKRVITVPDSFSALQAFRVMYMHRASAVGVVSARGKLVANLSASDLRGITADLEALESLFLPVLEFLATRTRHGPGEVKADQLKTVERDSSLLEAVRCVIVNKIHRVWIEDGKEKPVGVLTLGDMIAFFVPASLEEA